MIIVSLTSWPKRICNVATVLKSLLEQEMQPDIIQLNLSNEEFLNKEEDLPLEILNLIKNNENIKIEWVDGNDGVFKKIIPTLKKYYGEDYYLLSVDDDWIYRKDYIKTMVQYLEKYNSDSFCLSNSPIIGNRMIYKSLAFEKDFWEKLTPEIIKNRISDAYILHYLKSKGKKIVHYRGKETSDIMKKFNPIYPNSHCGKIRDIKEDENAAYPRNDVIRAEEAIRKIKF